jgi:2-phosphosulfolactate phosphatase
LVAAGERWPDASLRPCAEDLWGAGAVLSALRELGVEGFSPEADAAVAAYRAASLPEALRDCAGGRELVEAGFPEDVEVAAELDVSSVVPVLEGDRFVPARLPT